MLEELIEKMVAAKNALAIAQEVAEEVDPDFEHQVIGEFLAAFASRMALKDESLKIEAHNLASAVHTDY